MSTEQRALFDEAVDGNIASIDEQLAALQATAAAEARGREEEAQPARVLWRYSGRPMERGAGRKSYKAFRRWK